MHIVEIIRLETSKQNGTLGVLKLNKEYFCSTLEPADNENHSNISSIPTGQYFCCIRKSSKYGMVYEVMDVTDRTDVLMHAGNVDDNTLGCILVGQYPGKLKGDRAVLNSGNTLKQFMKETGEEPLSLTISEMY